MGVSREALRRRLRAGPQVGPFERARWRSPLRGPWMASFLGLALLVLFGLDLITGYLSYVAYQPTLGRNGVAGGGPDEILFGWRWPTSPVWLYGLNQGIHVTAGVAAIPILAAKLWTVMPKFYKWPAVKSPAEGLERLTLGLIMGSSIFLLFTGLFNIAYWYPWNFSFIAAHYYAAWVFGGSFVAHVVIKAPTMRRAFRERGVLDPLREDLAATAPEPYREDVSAPLESDAPRLSRRGMLGAVGVTSLGLVTLLVGQSIGGWTRRVALLAPRGGRQGISAQGFPVNKTVQAAGVTMKEMGDSWRLELVGRRTVSLSRADLLALKQRTETLPIACVEGWRTSQTWTGVPLRELARLAGSEDAAQVTVQSLQQRGTFSRATLHGGQIRAEKSLLALAVNGEDLAPDHGFPARVIIPAAPGVHNTKWVKRMTFRA